MSERKYDLLDGTILIVDDDEIKPGDVMFNVLALVDSLQQQLAERDRTIDLLTKQITDEVAISAEAIANLWDARALAIVGRYDDALSRMDKALGRE